MRTMKQGAVALAAVMAMLAGCSTTPTEVKPTAAAPAAPTAAETAKAQAAAQAAAAQAAAQAAAMEASRLAEKKRQEDAAAASARSLAAAAAATPPTQRIVYFDFDKYVIKDEFKSLVDAFAKYLVAAPAKRTVVEGHADERGGREYNLALGQKRAEAVLKSLTLLGASDKQLEAVSFGEERPAAAGHDESAWSKNRRAELKDR